MKLNLKTLRTAQALGLASLAALSLAMPAQAQMAQPMAPSASMPMGSMHNGAEGSQATKPPMMGGMPGMSGMHKMPMSGDTDKDFAMMMKMHHQGALEMAQVELDNGKSPEMKAMARSIIAAQKKEIVQLDRWLAKQK